MLCCSFLLIACYGIAQPDINQLHETAKAFMRQGDYANAVLVLNRGLQQSPGNVPLAKDLALSYYYQKDNNKALTTIKPLLDKNEVDDQCFQIAGNIYKELDMLKDCEKLYKKGIKRFPVSGPIYNDYGELLWAKKDYSAIKQWEKGIETDPSFSRNYYNASKFYYLTRDKVWSILYGENFINMEPQGNLTAEIKEILLESYKKLFANSNIEEGNSNKSAFAKAFLQNMNRQSGIAAIGINTESLTMIRTRFILDWSASYKTKFPYKLFEYQEQLLREGFFDAYNQWLFGSAENLNNFQQWTINHKEDYTGFSNFQKGRIFKIPEGQGYHD
jgi:tetratricopeptide (TPR) repeat protein